MDLKASYNSLMYGISAVKYMTPQRTAQVIEAQTAIIYGGTF
ncbi:hypothetical protein [Paenibacillus sp. FSL L8-0506]